MTTEFNTAKDSEQNNKQGFWGSNLTPEPETAGLGDTGRLPRITLPHTDSVEGEQDLLDEGVRAADHESAAAYEQGELLSDGAQNPYDDLHNTTEMPAVSEVATVPEVDATAEVTPMPAVTEPEVTEPDVTEPEVTEPGDSVAYAGDEQEEVPAYDLSWDDEPVTPRMDIGNPANYQPYDQGYVDVEPFSEYNSEAAMAAKKKKRRGTIIVVCIVLAVLLIGYFVGVYNYSNRLLPGTKINGLDVASLTVEEAKGKLEQQTKDYACEVSVDDLSTRVAGSDISMERDEESLATLAKQSQSPFAWPAALITPPSIELDPKISYDEDALRGIVEAAVDERNEQKLPSNNAGIEYDYTAEKYVLSGTTSGVAIDVNKVFDETKRAVDSFSYECKPAPEAVEREATVADIPSLSHTVENANVIGSNDIPLLMNGETVLDSSAEQNREFFSVQNGKATIDQDAVAGWAENTVAYAVYHSDDWSDYFLDVEKFVPEFCDRLLKGNVEPYEVPMYDELRAEGESRERAYEKAGWNSELGRYIDVDLECQFARLYNETGEVIWESAFVSGNSLEGHNTVTGTFNIYAMQTNQVLVGMDYNGDGESDYQSFVNYWMPFYGGYGLHDATWRSNFGGEYYYGNGSHGCINLPYSKAEQLFGMTHIGEVVNVHW